MWPFKIVVGDKPSIKKALNDVTSPVRNQISLKCTFDNGGLDVDVTWYKGTKELMKSKNHLMTLTGREAILTLKDLKATDAGDYSCVISNPLGKDKSSCKVSVSGESFNFLTFKISILNFVEILNFF